MDASWTAGPLYSLAALVFLAGIVKLGRPGKALAALRAAKIPVPAPAVRLLGLAEIALAVWVIADGSAWSAGTLGMVYLGFAAFSFRLLRVESGRVSCGCFGESSAATSPIHVVVNLVGAGFSAAAVVWPVGGIVDVLRSQPAFGVPFLALTALATWCWFAALALLPELLDAVSDVTADSQSEADAGMAA